MAKKKKALTYQAFDSTSKFLAEAEIDEQAKRIDYFLTEYTLELLVHKLDKNDFSIPSYQREFTWEPNRQSRFIESLLMGLPIPFLFFWESPDTGKLEIVDGSQRLRTIKSFIDNELILTTLDQLPALTGARFSDLTESRQRKFKNKSIRGIVLNKNADEAARLDLFDRLNTGSKHANKTEIRRGALAGPYMNLIEKAASLPLFHELAPVPMKAAKTREREELVTRFFAYSDGLDGYRDRVSDFMYEHVKTMNKRFSEDSSLEHGYLNRFETMLNFVAKNFPLGFRRTKDGIATPRARFEAIAVGSWFALRDQARLGTTVLDVDWVTSKAFREVTGADGANTIKRLRDRIDFVHQRLLALP